MDQAQSAGPARTGVLVLRVWMEGPGREAVRARITHTDDVTAPENERALSAAGVEEVLAVVRAWLESFSHG